MNEHLNIAKLCHSGALAGYEQQLWVRAEHVSLLASVGIYRGEKDSRQEIILNIAAEVGEPVDDRIGGTIDYRTLVQEAQKLTNEGHFELIETFICELGRRLVSQERVYAVDLELYKPGAIPPAMASVRYHVRKPSLSINSWRWGEGTQEKCAG